MPKGGHGDSKGTPPAFNDTAAPPHKTSWGDPAVTPQSARTVHKGESNFFQSSHLVMILPQVHLRKPCYDFYTYRQTDRPDRHTRQRQTRQTPVNPTNHKFQSRSQTTLEREGESVGCGLHHPPTFNQRLGIDHKCGKGSSHR